MRPQPPPLQCKPLVAIGTAFAKTVFVVVLAVVVGLLASALLNLLPR